jgi:hypothetical protein
VTGLRTVELVWDGLALVPALIGGLVVGTDRDGPGEPTSVASRGRMRVLHGLRVTATAPKAVSGSTASVYESAPPDPTRSLDRRRARGRASARHNQLPFVRTAVLGPRYRSGVSSGVTPVMSARQSPNGRPVRAGIGGADTRI